MIGVSRVMPVRPDRVWAVLANGWSYAGWVVGNAHIREVDDDWPSEGSRIYHKAGMWPLHTRDVSTVVALAPGRMLELEARLWVLGRARVRLTLAPEGQHSTRVTLEEEAVSGLAGLLPRPVQAAGLRPRNVETLARLQDLAIGMTRPKGGGTAGPHGTSAPESSPGPS